MTCWSLVEQADGAGRGEEIQDCREGLVDAMKTACTAAGTRGGLEGSPGQRLQEAAIAPVVALASHGLCTGASKAARYRPGCTMAHDLSVMAVVSGRASNRRVSDVGGATCGADGILHARDAKHHVARLASPRHRRRPGRSAASPLLHSACRRTRRR